VVPRGVRKKQRAEKDAGRSGGGRKTRGSDMSREIIRNKLHRKDSQNKKKKGGLGERREAVGFDGGKKKQDELNL